MASSKWKSFGELSALLMDRSYVLWGASNWVNPTIQELDLEPEYILDTNPNNEGIEFEGYLVRKPDIKELKTKGVFIVISTGNYDTLCKELERDGFEMGVDFCVTPLLQERGRKDDLLGLSGKVLFCSPEHRFLETEGGGLYELDLSTGLQRKVYTGKCRTIQKCGDGYALIDMLSGVKVLDKNYRVTKELSLPFNSEPHGLFYDQNKDIFFIGCPGNDCVYSVDSNGNILKEFRISDKFSRKRADYHHINDVYSIGDSLFVSMFSLTGNWPNDCYDGGIIEFDSETGNLIGPVWHDLWMPHSICKYKNTLATLDSMTGRLLTANRSIEIELPGFLRGLDFLNDFAVIAVSSHRYPEKVKVKKYPILMNAQIYLVDLLNGMARSITISGTPTIHSVIFT